MAVYDISDVEKEEVATTASQPSAESNRERFFSVLASRIFFVLLLAFDLAWASYAIFLASVNFIALSLTLYTSPFFKQHLRKALTSIRRALVCALALVVALFSPAFGIMVACTYFLMYDKAGIEEVIPLSIQHQFKDLFKNISPENK
jgi:hypothetical protein